MIKLICFLSIVAYATSASVKREEYNPDPLLALTNQVNANRDQSSVGSSNNSPVYSPNGYQTYSSSYGNQVLSNSNPVSNYGSQPDANANQPYVDNVASASNIGSNIPSSQPNQPNYSNNQGNLYYYYYPVQDKNKEIGYQASPSNQYSSSIVQPQNVDDQSNQNNANMANNQQMSANSQMNNNHGQDLNYGGAQDLAYTASGMNENNNPAGNQQGGLSGNYDNQMSNLASAFGFGASSNAFGGGNSQFASQLAGLNNMNFGEAFGGSSIQPNSVPFVNDPAFSAAMASQMGSFSPNGQVTSSSGGPFSQLYQTATNMYQGLINGATGNSGSLQPQFAASQQHASYEPSSGSGSSFRSKYGLGSVVLPLMALAGLSLLIPTVTSLSTVSSRKKRSADIQQIGLDAYLERIDRYYSLYKNAIEREECMNRIICEIGEAVSGVKGKDAFLEFVEHMIPNGWINKQGNNKMSIFKNSVLKKKSESHNDSKCKNYKCH